MRIELKSLTLTNFKGIKQLQVKFDHETAIFGANATGKTTLLDAFQWNHSGKDSEDREVFGIKTYDANGKVIPMIDHEVISQFSIWNADDNDLPRLMVFKRTLKEVWQKPRGQAESVFKGNETIYNVDSVPCTEKEYKEKINILCPENIFKLLTNPAYFTGLNWSIQRQSLFSLIPEITNLDIVKEIPAKTRNVGKFDELMKLLNAATNVLNSEKVLSDHKKKISAEKKLLKDELDKIPDRIDEVERGKPELRDWDTLARAISDAEAFIARKNEEKSNKLLGLQSETDKRAGIQKQIDTVKQQLNTLKYSIEDSIREKFRDAQTKKAEHDRYISDYNDLIQKATNNLKGYELDMQALQGERTKLIDEWKSLNAEVMPEWVIGTCPTCGQEYPDDNKSRIREDRKSVV
jgi:predicted ATP-dependent endonuclease of OLD family